MAIIKIDSCEECKSYETETICYYSKCASVPLRNRGKPDDIILRGYCSINDHYICRGPEIPAYPSVPDWCPKILKLENSLFDN